MGGVRGLTVKEAAAETGYSEEYLRRLVRQERIAAVKVGLMHFIDPESLRAYVTAMRNDDDERTGPKP